MILIPKGSILKCRHCHQPMYEVTDDIGVGKIDLPDGGWKHATLLSIHTVKPIAPQTIGEDASHDCVNCGQHDFGV